jgi:hypothetical protein
MKMGPVDRTLEREIRDGDPKVYSLARCWSRVTYFLCLTIKSSQAEVLMESVFLIDRSAFRETDGEMSFANALWISFSSSSRTLILS